MVGITTDQIWAGAVDDVQCFINGRSHADSPFLVSGGGP
jgi:hypothetical protein